MKIIVLTSVRRGIASACLPVLCGNPHIEVRAVILAHSPYTSRIRKLKRRLSKLWRVGLLGMINGQRLKKLFRDRAAEDIAKVCETYKVPFHETEFINGDETKKLFRGCDADLGLSLGCGYIPKSVFGIPKHGMINIHTEVLPRFQAHIV